MTREKHLELIQGVINRMAGNSFHLKGWSVVLVSALFALAASNAKVLRLHRVAREVKERFGNKEKLVDALLVLSSKTKDTDFRDKLLRFSPVRLLTLHRSWEKHGVAAK